jgi:hypothetical protein
MTAFKFCFQLQLAPIQLGFILGEHAYLRDTFNCVDFVVVLLSILVGCCTFTLD